MAKINSTKNITSSAALALKLEMGIDTYLQQERWSLVSRKIIPGHKGETSIYMGTEISKRVHDFLIKSCPKGIFHHQEKAIKHFLMGRNVCLATKTASGKSLVFYACGIEQLEKNPSSKIIAIYPLKALGKEQEERWKSALKDAGLNVIVGRIDGQTPLSARQNIVKESSVLILTPDIIHAWLLSNLSNKSVVNFIKNISLIIVDEIHEYKGVFGSNSAFLFRRLRHIFDLFNSTPQYICASATISKPKEHLTKLFGLDFSLVDSSYDTSPQSEVKVDLFNPPGESELLTEVSKLLINIAYKTDVRFICFVDSRKQTELVSSIVTRAQDKSNDEESNLNWDHLHNFNVLPYRAGYEENDRATIQRRLSDGSLSGVISTSALELGLDIPHLNMAILIGVPNSQTSLHQRIGRIGRQSKGRVIIINSGSVYDQSIFRHPDELLTRPLAESALYLENNRIQYIHALCLARHDGEHDQAASSGGVVKEVDFVTRLNWPNGFIDICKKERIGEIPVDLQNMKSQSGDNPNHIFPLRDVDLQFKIEYKRGPEQRLLGSLSYGQLMREAYPGAVYYYTTLPYRVYNVDMSSRVISVRSEKRFTTKSIMLPTLVFPNLTSGNVYSCKKFDTLLVAECNLQIRESITGFKERRGPNEARYSYPLDSSKSGIYFSRARFTRNYFTTGVVLTHPALNSQGVQCEIISNILFEAFLMVVPFEKRDVHYANDVHRTERERVPKGSKFIAIYDQTYGSLRLSGRLSENTILQKSLDKSLELLVQLKQAGEAEVSKETLAALNSIRESSLAKETNFVFEGGEAVQKKNNRFERIIMPGSKGLFVKNNNEECIIKSIFYDPRESGLRYGVKKVTSKNENVGVKISILAKDVVEIPGESKFGFYDYDNGEVVANVPLELGTN